MLDDDFLLKLEYKICSVFASMEQNDLRWFWCDGILLSEPDKYYTQKFINDNRQTKLKAYVGKDGESAYTLTLHFGPKSLSRCARNLEIATCIPQTDAETWFHIDVENSVIEIQLD